jgi:hypothetical protein
MNEKLKKVLLKTLAVIGIVFIAGSAIAPIFLYR